MGKFIDYMTHFKSDCLVSFKVGIIHMITLNYDIVFKL